MDGCICLFKDRHALVLVRYKMDINFSTEHIYDLAGKLYSSHTMGRGIELAGSGGAYVLDVPPALLKLFLEDDNILRTIALKGVLDHYVQIKASNWINDDQELLAWIKTL